MPSLKQLLSNVCSVLSVFWKCDVSSVQIFVFYNVSSLLPALPHILFFSFLVSCMCVYLHVHVELLFLEISSLKKWHFQETTSCFQVYTKSRETDLICILEWFHEQWLKSKIFKSKMSKARYNPLVKGGYTGATLVNQSSHSHSLFISWVDLSA